MAKLSPLGRTMDDILKCRSIEQVWARHAEIMAGYGFDRMIYASNRFRASGEFGDPDDAMLLINHEPDYIEGFIGKALFLEAPMSLWSANNTGACSWQWAQNRRANGLTTDGENRALDFNEKMGVTAGISISFENISARAMAGIGLCAQRGRDQLDVDRQWVDHGDELFLLNNLLHHKISLLPYERLGKPLTVRQKEVLQWVADGKTIQDIAQIMQLNAATVEKHMRLARASLNVETTAQAILKASLQNQFFLVDNYAAIKGRKTLPSRAK